MSLAKNCLRTINKAEMPVSTPELVKLHQPGKKWGRQAVWVELRELERRGLIRRTKRSPSGSYWAKVSASPTARSINSRNRVAEGRRDG